MQNNISVIINGYDTANVLKKALLGFNAQTYRNFEMIIAGNDIGAELEDVKNELFYPVTFIGNQNGQMMDKALAACKTDYILMASGNCIPRQNFVEEHIKYREEGYFLTGDVKEIVPAVFEGITKEAIYSGKCFTAHASVLNKGLTASILNRLFPANGKWNADNASAWRKDIGDALANEDKWKSNLTHNLELAGIKPKQIQFSAVCLGPKKI